MASAQKKIIEGVFFGSIGNVVIKIFAAVCYALILRKFSLHDYGTFVLLVSLVGPASSIVLFSFDRIFVSNVALAFSRKEFSRMKGLTQDYYRTSLIIGIFFFAGLYLLRGFLVRYYDFYLIQYFTLTCVFIISQLLMNMTSLFLEGNQRFKEISFMESLESISRALLVVFGFFFFPFTVSSVLIIYTAGKCAAVLLGLFYTSRLRKTMDYSNIVPEKKVLSTIFKSYGKWDLASNFLQQMLAPVKLFVLKIFVNIESVAVYDFARNVYSFITNIFPIKSVIFPVISGAADKPAVLSLIIQKSRKYLLAVYTVLFFAVLVCSPIVLRIIFPQYIGQEFAIYLIMLHLFTEVYKIGQDALLYAFKKQKFMFQVLPALTAVSVLLDVFFAKEFGVTGTIISWHIFAIVNGLVYQHYLSRSVSVVRARWRDIFHYDDYDREITGRIFKKAKSMVSFE